MLGSFVQTELGEPVYKDTDMFGIIANVKSDRALRTGAKVCILSNGSSASSVYVMGISKFGRTIRKYVQYKRLENFRAAFIPEHLRKEVEIFSTDKTTITKAANKLNSIWAGVRYFHRNGNLLQDGITLGQALKRIILDANYIWRSIAPLKFMESLSHRLPW